MPFGEIVHAVRPASAVQRVGDEHRIVERRDGDAVPLQHKTIVLHVLTDLQDGFVFEQSFNAASPAATGTCTMPPSPKSKAPLALRWPSVQ